MAATTGNIKEKQWAATSSAIAAVGLTAFKIVVGVLTGSLGILAEAAHSGLDLVAAIMTVYAVHVSDKPADKTHPYGYGKVENLSALVETGLLLLTCAWIIYSAVRRLFSGQVDIEVGFWSFFVMATSITIDISRSRMLSHAAKKFNSQALEADALHFSTDIWSSAVVIFGLVCVKVGELHSRLHFLAYADAVAAIFVALIVVNVSVKLGRRTVDALIDMAPEGLQEKITEAVSKLPGVKDCHNVRLRYSGANLFVDLHILTDGHQPLKEAHDLTVTIEQVVQQISPGADVTVHPEPF